MKVVYLTDNLDYKNGGGRFSRELISQLKLAVPDLQQTILVKSAVGADENCLVIGTNKLVILGKFFQLRSLIRRCDLIHVFDGLPYGLLAAILAWGLHKPIIITVVGSGSVKPLQSYWSRWLLSGVYRRAERVIAISSFTAREIVKKVPGLQVEIIRPGIDRIHFLSLAASISGQPNEYAKLSPFILSVGRLKPRKGYLQSLQVFVRLREEFPLLKYVIVGSGGGEYWQKMQAYIRDYNLEDAVIILNNISDQELAKLYSAAELFLLLPQNDNFDIEGFGLVYVEAACFGLPVIGATDSGAEDALQQDFNGYLVSPADPESAKAAVRKILTNSELKQTLSLNSRTFSQQLDWSMMRQGYEKIYHELSGAYEERI
ncbi:MAG: glycosyltransferase family 4 protein [Candidatus Komeilibacteria bacterium]